MTRPSNPNLDKILGKEIPVLDKGFIRVIDYMGDDAAVVQAARVSYGSGTKSIREDQKLIAYLIENNHSSPLEMCEIKFHVKLPIFVARQWIRHRTANVNEYSARYSILDREFYIPESEYLMKSGAQSNKNKQGSEGALSKEDVDAFLRNLMQQSENCYLDYEQSIDKGISREISRMTLPLNYYTQWYWKIDLRNLLHFINLRMDSHAQFEIRQYASVIADIIKMWCPDVYDAFEEFILYSETLAKTPLEILRAHLNGEIGVRDILLKNLNERQRAEMTRILGVQW